MTVQNKNKPGYKKTKVGLIPEAWDVVRIKDCISKTRGIDPTKVHNKTFKYIDISSICNDTYRIQGHQSINSINAPSRARKEIKAKDILYATVRPYLKRIAIVPAELDGQVCSTGFCVLRCHPKKIDYNYLFNVLLSAWMTTKISKLQTGSNYPAVNDSDIHSQSIPLPHIKEQEKMAAILGKWDEGIEKTENLIQSKQALKKALMQQLLTGKKRFKEFKGQEWKENCLGDIFKHRKERGNDHLPLLAITGADGITDREELERRDTSNTDKSKYLRICPGDIGYNTMRMWQGVNGVSELEGIVSPAYTICIPDTKRVAPSFMGYLFKFHPVVFLFYRYSQGLVSDTWNLKFHHFAEIRVTIPPLKEQQKIASVLNAADKEIVLLCDKLETLKNQKKGLMQKLLTGKIRVKVQGWNFRNV